MLLLYLLSYALTINILNNKMELQKPNNDGQNPKPGPENEKMDQNNEAYMAESLFEEVESTCSTPYVTAPSSPGRGSGPVSNGGFYYSAPASPMHFALTASYPATNVSSGSSTSSVSTGFEFGSGSSANGSMSSANELFLDGMIRPMKLLTHLEKPQVLAPVLDLDQEAEAEAEEAEVISIRGRDIRVVIRDKSMKRRTRSLSPLGSTFDEDHVTKSASCFDNKGNNNNKEPDTTADALSESSSRSSSSAAGRSTSKSWVFLKEFLYRSKSEGRSNNKFWSTISFSPITNKDKKLPTCSSSNPINNNVMKNKPVNGIAGKRRSSPQELHYTANRAQAEEMRKKTYMPYKQGLLGCLGFSSKGYGAMNGVARALNPVSSR